MRSADRDEYHHAYVEVIRALVDRCEVMVAPIVGVDGVEAGWACAERTRRGPCLHYAYVKGDYRKLGIGARLWTAALMACGWDGERPVLYTHRREPFASWAVSKGWKYAPFLTHREAA